MTNVTKQLQQALADHLAPVKPAPWAYLSTIRWIIVFSLCLIVGLSWYAHMNNHPTSLFDPLFLTFSAVMWVAAICAMAAAFQLSLPQAKISRRTWVLLILAILLWLGLACHAVCGSTWGELRHELDLNHAHYCAADLILLSLLPITLLILMLRRAAPTRFGLAGFATLLAVASLAAIASNFLCTMETPAHMFIWHFLPVLIVGGFGILLGKLLLKW